MLEKGQLVVLLEWIARRRGLRGFECGAVRLAEERDDVAHPDDLFEALLLRLVEREPGEHANLYPRSGFIRDFDALGDL